MSNTGLLNDEQAEIEQADAELVVIERAESPPVGASNEDDLIYEVDHELGQFVDVNGNPVERDGNPINNVPEPDIIAQNLIVQNDIMQNEDFRQDFNAYQEDYGLNPQNGHDDANGYDL